MNKRIKLIRESLNMTQQEFATLIGSTRTNIAGYEANTRSPSTTVVSAICQKCKINEEWLRTGEGEMYINLTREQSITDFMADVLLEKDDSFKKQCVLILSKLDEHSWKALEQITNNIIKIKKD